MANVDTQPAALLVLPGKQTLITKASKGSNTIAAASSVALARFAVGPSFEKGKSECSDTFRQIKDYIHEKMKNINRVNSLKAIKWGTDESDRIIKNIQSDVLRIFE